MRNLQTEQPEHTFRLKTYKKNELAMMYFPDVTKDAASRNFRRWIRQCPPMMKELQAMGYDKNRQYLLKAEVEVIVAGDLKFAEKHLYFIRKILFFVKSINNK